MKIALIGTGVYGLAIATAINKNYTNIVMWSESKERYDKYLQDGCIKDIIPDFVASKDIILTNSYEEAVKDAEVVFITSTAVFVSQICKEIKPFLSNHSKVCIASKGIDNKTCSFLSDIAQKELGIDNIAVLSGPSFAVDLAYNNPVGLSLAAKNKETIVKVKKVLENDTLKIRETEDLIGVQICGSVKNIIAVASGMLDGMGYPESTQSLLITEALNDVKHLIVALGGEKNTILHLAGVGDMILTCTSTKSRNFSFGRVVGIGSSREEINTYLKENTVEGYYTLQSIYQLIKNKKIEMPIIDLIYNIIMNEENPKMLVDFLINKK